MSESDTVKLLKKCYSGTEMTAGTVCCLLRYTGSDSLKKIMKNALSENGIMADRIKQQLENRKKQVLLPGKFTVIMAEGNIRARMLMNSSPSNAAHIIFDGCSMGVKQLWEFRNEYIFASPEAKNTADSLIMLHENLSAEIRPFL